jgi:hypothetical protein
MIGKTKTLDWLFSDGNQLPMIFATVRRYNLLMLGKGKLHSGPPGGIQQYTCFSAKVAITMAMLWQPNTLSAAAISAIKSCLPPILIGKS